MLKSNIAIVALSAFAFFAGNASATGLVAGATEFTQIANNIEIGFGVEQQIETVAQLVKTYQTTLQVLDQAQRAGKLIKGESIQSSRAALLSEMNSTTRYVTSLANAKASMSDLRSDINQRSVESKIAGLTFRQYVEREAAKVQKGDVRAKQRLATEENLMQQVNEDFEVAKELSGQITQTAGVHESVGLLNSQMNRVIQQNARMTQIMANATGTEQADRMAKETAARDDAVQRIDQADQAHRLSVQQQLDDINAAIARNKTRQ